MKALGTSHRFIALDGSGVTYRAFKKDPVVCDRRDVSFKRIFLPLQDNICTTGNLLETWCGIVMYDKLFDRSEEPNASV